MFEDDTGGVGKGIILRVFLEQCQQALLTGNNNGYASSPLDQSYFPPSFSHNTIDPSMDLMLHLQIVSRDKLQKQELFIPATSTLFHFTGMLQCLQKTYFKALEPATAPFKDGFFGMETCIIAAPGAPCLAPFDREFKFRYEVLPWGEGLRWLDLPFAVHCNTPYVYIHQECCVHYFIIKSIRTTTTNAATEEKNGKILEEIPRIPNRKKCRICETHSATLVISNCTTFLPSNELKGVLLCCQFCFEILLPGCILDVSRWDGRSVKSLVELTEEQKVAWGAEMAVYPLYYNPFLHHQQ